jgi:uncharacterized membrane protein
MVISAVQKPLIDRLVTNELLAGLCTALCVVVAIAIARGASDWARVPPLVWLHLGTVLFAMALAPVMLLRRKGTRWHRRLGYVWMSAMLGTAVISLFFKSSATRPNSLGVFTGDISPIHLISVYVLLMGPLVIARARQHDRVRHERAVRGLVIGALLVAGVFTLPFGRMLGNWLTA